MSDKRRHEYIINIRPLSSSRVSNYTIRLCHRISQQLLVGFNGHVKMLELLKLLRERGMGEAKRVILSQKWSYCGVVGVKELPCLTNYGLRQGVEERILFRIWWNGRYR